MRKASGSRLSSLPVLFILVMITAGTGYSMKTPGKTSLPYDGGLNLLPVPKKLSLTGETFIFNITWMPDPGNNLPADNPALQSLIAGIKELTGTATLASTAVKGNNPKHFIRLSIREGSVPVDGITAEGNAEILDQAYLLELNRSGIEIKSNGPAGLFYGVQTLLQLIKEDNGHLVLPEGVICDWPDLELRTIYWDCAHHLDKLQTLKRALREASSFKINGFALKLEGHFQFSGAGPVVEPYAFTSSEYQELTDYAKAHYIQLIPYLDAPAHVSFVLKHPEYAHLRAFPKSNYEFSITNKGSIDLISSMFEDLITASNGSKFILLSTDEAYYVGGSASERDAAIASGSKGGLLAGFITSMADKLHEKGRDVIFWGEYPLTPSDIHELPSHVINGEYNESWDSSFRQRGIRQLIYTSVQGVEPLFPNYYRPASKSSYPGNGTLVRSDDQLQQPDASNGRVDNLLRTVYNSVSGEKPDIMGIIVAAWGDSGLHPETFWLGYATGAATAWNLAPTNAGDLSERFFASFYGNKSYKMDRIYQLLSTQAEFWNDSWDTKPSRLRSPILGNSKGMYDIPKQATDQTLPSLQLPTGNSLTLTRDWSTGNQKRLQSAELYLKENNELIDLLNHNMNNAVRHQYNLSVMLSLAKLCRQNLNMILDLQRIDKYLKLSSNVAGSNPAAATSLLDKALDQVRIIRNSRNESLRSLTAVWYQDWYPVVPEANGRKYFFQVDDIKDHLPGRTTDMSYLIYRELHYPLGKWAEDLRKIRNRFAAENNLPQRNEIIDWEHY